MSTVRKSPIKNIESQVKKLGGWHMNAKATEISKTYSVSSFVAGLSVLARIAVHAEILGHHPTVELSYSTLKVKLTTHDVKGLTKLDFELAKRIDALKMG